MPYINQKRRDELNTMSKYHPPQTAGELNYRFTQALIYSEDQNTLDTALTVFATGYIMSKDELSYQVLNDIMGAALCAGAEWSARTGIHRGWRTECLKDFLVWFYKDIARPYEEEKCKKNGDVYPARFGGTAKEEWPRVTTPSEVDLMRGIFPDNGQAPIGQYGPETA